MAADGWLLVLALMLLSAGAAVGVPSSIARGALRGQVYGMYIPNALTGLDIGLQPALPLRTY